MGDFSDSFKGFSTGALTLAAVPGAIALFNQLFGLNGTGGIFNRGGFGGFGGFNGYGFCPGTWNNGCCDNARDATFIVGHDRQSEKISALMSEIGQLKAEKNSDVKIADVYSALRNEINAVSDRLTDKYISPMAQEISASQVREARMEEQIRSIRETSQLREQLIRSEFTNQINQCCCTMNAGLTALNGTVNCLANTVSQITHTVIPRTAICPEVMPAYNSWVAPTGTAPATQPVTATVT